MLVYFPSLNGYHLSGIYWFLHVSNLQNNPMRQIVSPVLDMEKLRLRKVKYHTTGKWQSQDKKLSLS